MQVDEKRGLLLKLHEGYKDTSGSLRLYTNEKLLLIRLLAEHIEEEKVSGRGL